jgi:lipopolysaccharide export system protein LptC
MADDDDSFLKASPKERLGRLLGPGESRGFSQAYSRFVRILRLALPLAAAALVGLLMSWPQLEKTMEQAPAAAIVPQNAARNELLDPHFQSTDSDNQPFNLAAKRAVQSTNNPEVVLLEAPQAGITLKDGTNLAAQADKGAFQQKAGQLLLEGDVTLSQDKGYEVKTQKLLVNLKERKAWSDQPVSGHGPAGTLAAAGVRMETEEGLLVFTGPAKLVLTGRIKGL